MLRALSASLANLRVGVRLGFAFGIVLLGTLLMAAAALHAQQTQSRAVAQALDVHVHYVVSVLRVRTQLANMRRAEKDMIINTAHVDEVKRHWDGWQGPTDASPRTSGGPMRWRATWSRANASSA